MQKTKDDTASGFAPDSSNALIHQITRIEEMIRINEIIIRDTGRKLRLNQKELAVLKNRLIEAYEREKKA